MRPDELHLGFGWSSRCMGCSRSEANVSFRFNVFSYVLALRCSAADFAQRSTPAHLPTIAPDRHCPLPLPIHSTGLSPSFLKGIVLCF
jgi:hypothetical protein